MLTKHAARTDVLVAHLAEELDLLVLVLEAEHFPVLVHASLVGANRDRLEHAAVRSDPNWPARLSFLLFIALMGLTILLLLCRLVAVLSVDGLDLFVVYCPNTTYVLARL